MEQKINVPNDSSGANLQNPLMLVNNMYYCDAHRWPKNTAILIAGDSMINGINEKRFSANFKSVKVRCYSGVTTDDMYFNLIPLFHMWVPTIRQIKYYFRLIINCKIGFFLLKKLIQNVILSCPSQSIDLMMEKQLPLLRG